MLNPLKWKFKDLKQPCIPTGPDFSSAREIKFSLNDTIVSFYSPPSTPIQLGPLQSPQDNYSIYQDAQYITEVGRDNLPRLDLFYLGWAYYGPAFTGYVGELSLAGAVIAPRPTHKNFSVFNPNDFEHLIETNERHYYGNEEDFTSGRPDSQLPVNWRIVSGREFSGISYEVVPMFNGARIQMVLLPLRHDRYLELSFHFSKKFLGNYQETEAMISSAPMNELAENIINSLSIQLSEAAQREKEEIQAKFPHAKHTENVAPYKLTTPEQDAKYEAEQAALETAARVFNNE